MEMVKSVVKPVGIFSMTVNLMYIRPWWYSLLCMRRTVIEKYTWNGTVAKRSPDGATILGPKRATIMATAARHVQANKEVIHYQ